MDRSIRNERGAVLVIIALLGTLLIMFVAMAIDISMAANSRQAAEQYARLASLAAVEGYFSAAEGMTEAEKRQLAVDRANSILKSNAVINNQTSGTNFAREIVLWDGEGSPPDPDQYAMLEAGRWYYKMPIDAAEAAKVHCTPPCFQRMGADEPANAMKLTGTLYASYTSAFANAAVGQTANESKVSSIGGVTPRHGCFLIDLSPGMVNQTHLVREAAAEIDVPAPGFGSMFGFFRAKDNDVAGYNAGLNYCSRNAQGKAYQRDECGWSVLRDHFPTRSDPETEVDPDREITGGDPYRHHFASDYRKMQLLGDVDYLSDNRFVDHHPSPYDDAKYSVGNRRWAIVDSSRSTDLGGTRTDGYIGPEPLTSVMAGLRTAIQTFKENKVFGDKLCLIFYDEDLQWPRIVKLTGDFDYLLSFTDFTNITTLHQDCATPETDSALCNVASANMRNATGFERAVRHGLFPLANSHTDTLEAVTEGESQLAAGTEAGVPTSDFLLLIGDGLVNCPNDRVCDDSYLSYVRASSQLKNIIETRFKPRNVYVHAMLIGDNVGPHTVKMLNPDTNKCYTDIEARGQTGVPWVMGGTEDYLPITSDVIGEDLFQNSKPDTPAADYAPFYQANADMFELVKATRGVWAPIRTKTPPGGCVQLDPARDCTSTPARLETDPMCRSASNQIKTYMKDIMGRHPYAVVGRE